MNELALFAGAGGGILASKSMGWRTVCAVERDAYAAQVLTQRQNDRLLETFPIWSDVKSFDGRSWKGIIDIISAGFPCQDISPAGKRGGIEGSKSGLWREVRRITDEVRPNYVFVENSGMLISRGLAVVISDFAEMGYDAVWQVVHAAEVGAEHVRPRTWILAYANSTQRKRGGLPGRVHKKHANTSYTRWGKDKPGVDRVVDGVAHRVDRLKAIGNGQVPQCAEEAFKMLRSLIDI